MASTRRTWSSNLAGPGGTTSTSLIRIGAGLRMKLTWEYEPSTTTHFTPGKASAAAASWDGTAVSTLSSTTTAQSSGPASTRAATVSVNRSSDGLRSTSTSATRPSWRATTNRVRKYTSRSVKCSTSQSGSRLGTAATATWR